MSDTEAFFAMTMAPTDTPNFFTPIASTPVTVPSFGYGLGGESIPDGFLSTGCLQGCFMSPIQASGYKLLEATFSAPTDIVNVQIGAQYENGAIVMALNQAGQIIASCVGDGTSTATSCYSLQSPGISLYSLSAPGITSVLIGGIGGTVEQVWNVDPPVKLDAPVGFYLLLLGIVAMWRPKIETRSPS